MPTIFQEIRISGSRALSKYLEDGGDLFIREQRTGETLLHTAAMVGDLDSCETLHLCGISKDVRDTFKNSPFNYASLGMTLKRKNGDLTKEEELRFKRTLRFLYIEEDQGISVEKFFGPEVFDYVI